jgi:hypothetical protein
LPNGQSISIGELPLSAKVRRWIMREDNIRRAGWAGVTGAGIVSLFNLVYAVVGVAAWLGMATLPREVRFEYTLNVSGWTLAMALLAWLFWNVSQRREPSMWLALMGSILVSIFALSVLTGVYAYDVGGALQDPSQREGLYVLFAPLAVAGVFLSALALVTNYQLKQWDRPVISPSPAAASQTT